MSRELATIARADVKRRREENEDRAAARKRANSRKLMGWREEAAEYAGAILGPLEKPLAIEPSKLGKPEGTVATSVVVWTFGLDGFELEVHRHAVTQQKEPYMLLLVDHKDGERSTRHIQRAADLVED